MGDMIFCSMSDAGLALMWAQQRGIPVTYHRLGIAAYALNFATEADRRRFVQAAQEILERLPATSLTQIREAIVR